MAITLRLLVPILVGLFSLPVAARSCYVVEQTSGAVPPPVVTEKCFEYQGVEENLIDWVCQDNKAVKNSRRELRDSCPGGYLGQCTATLTPATLANEQAAGSLGDGIMPSTVPEQAKILTYIYQTSNRAQAQIDCQSAGGQWSQ